MNTETILDDELLSPAGARVVTCEERADPSDQVAVPRRGANCYAVW